MNFAILYEGACMLFTTGVIELFSLWIFILALSNGALV
jgi:hypothetical protein